MLKSLVVKNFQSHALTKIKFTPGVNVVLGPSDHGKSVLLRVVEWVRTNRPRTVEELIRWGQAKVLVRVNTELGTVVRKRGTGTGSYVVNEEEFQKFKHEVPAAVQSVLQLTDINIQLQGDQHFLICDTPAEVASKLNRITKLSLLSDGLQELKRRSAKIKEQLEQSSVQLSAVSKHLCPAAATLLKKAVDLQFKINLFRSREENLSTKRENVHAAVVSIKAAQKALQPQKRIAELSQRAADVQKVIGEYTALRGKWMNINTMVTELTRLLQQSSADEVDVREAKEKLQELEANLKACPKCGSTLDGAARSRLLGGSQ